jgi:endonuclease/exonuclease/phosphatase family metal-dependent hydrolase
VSRLRCTLAIAALMAGLSTVGGGPLTALAQTRPPGVVLRVMTFNMAGGEWGWEHGPGSRQTAADERAVVAAIRAARADVVGLQEPFGRTRLIARMLGPSWHAYPRLHTVSRYPILEPGGANGVYGFLQVAPGRVVAVFNTHLPSLPYGPYGVRDGKGLARVLHNEAVGRIPWMRPILAAARPLIAAGMPTILTGDFNSPSWRDWTPRVVRARGLPYSVRWPVSLAIERAGFHDTYRMLHPDVLRHLGFTWPSGWPTFSHRTAKYSDRIDLVWAAGPATPLRSQIVGHPSAFTNIPVQPWVSDHRAVVTTLRVRPAVAPNLVSVESARVTRGRPIVVRFHAPRTAGAIVELRRGGAIVAEQSTGADADGRLQFSSASLRPGIYSVALSGLGTAHVAATSVTIVAPGARPTVSVARHVFAVGEPIAVSWRNDPGNRYDWLSVNARNGTPLTLDLLEWRYVGAAVDGQGTIGKGDHGDWPLPAGRYRVWLCLDDGYVCWDSAAFRVQ